MENSSWYWIPAYVQPAQPEIAYVPPRSEIAYGPLRRTRRANNYQNFRPKQMWVPKREWEMSNTTVMIKNVPKKYRRDSFIVFLDKCCLDYQLEYDFLYLPMTYHTGENKGYAFVNCTNVAIAIKMKELFRGYRWGTYHTEYGIYTSIRYSDSAWAKTQGIDAMMKNFARTEFHCNNFSYLPVHFSPPRNGYPSAHPKFTIIGQLKGSYNYNSLFI